jgi:hypothetical protein
VVSRQRRSGSSAPRTCELRSVHARPTLTAPICGAPSSSSLTAHYQAPVTHLRGLPQASACWSVSREALARMARRSHVRAPGPRRHPPSRRCGRARTPKTSGATARRPGPIRGVRESITIRVPGVGVLLRHSWKRHCRAVSGVCPAKRCRRQSVAVAAEGQRDPANDLRVPLDVRRGPLSRLDFDGSLPMTLQAQVRPRS